MSSVPAPVWQALLDAVPQLVWAADRSGEVWYYNDRVRLYRGVDQAEDGSWGWATVVHSDDRAKTERAWARAVATAEPYECEHRLAMADGSFRWHVSRARFAQGDGTESEGLAWFGTSTDVHEQVLAQHAARTSEDRLTQLIDGLFTFVGLCSPDGTLLGANKTALDAGGLGRSDVIGKPFWEAYWWNHSRETQLRLQRAIRLAARGESSRYDVDVRVAGGHLITIDFQLVPVVEGEVVTALIPSGIDISDRISEHDRLEALATFAYELIGTNSTDEVMRLVVDRVPGVVDADFVNVALVDTDSNAMVRVQPELDTEVEQRWTVLPLDGPATPFHEALGSGKPVFVSKQERVQRFGHMVADTDRVGLDTTAALPLIASTWEPFGVVGIGWKDPTEITRPLRARLQLVADVCGQALERSRRVETQNDLIRELQTEVLSNRETATALDVAVLYKPAESVLGFGGDWYDVIAVADDCTVFVVGDVAGHGAAAAARMTATKATVRTLVLTAERREDVVPLTTVALDHMNSAFVATVALAWIDAHEETVEVHLVGHLPPVARSADGRVELLGAKPHPPVGMPTGPRTGMKAPFPRGSVVVLYTDGLIERRGQDIDVSVDRLMRTIEGLPPDASAADVLADLDAALIGPETTDDVAIVVIRNARPQPPVDGPPTRPSRK